MTIDVHGHLSPPASMRRFPMPPSLGDAEGMIEGKLRHGVRMTIIGSPVGAGTMVPFAGVDNYAQDDDDLRRFHDWTASLVDRYPDHLRAYVYVNPFGGDRHLELAAETLRAPQFIGFIANTSVAGRYLLDPAADGFFALAEEVTAPVLLHAPAAPAAGSGLPDPLLVEQIGRFCDVTVGVAACILGGWIDKYPGLRLIATAGGGALALLGERMDHVWDAPHWHTDRRTQHRRVIPELRERPSSYLRRIWVDTASPNRTSLALNAEAVGIDKVLYGTDSPPVTPRIVGDLLSAIADLPLSETGRQAIRETNALRLFGDRLSDLKETA